MIPNSENKRVWFITGASKGLGYAFTCAALKAGDKVVAVARTIDNLAKLEETYQESLLPLNLDVTDREAVFSTVETAVKHFGRLDIVVNNAGIMTMGMIEELNESDARKLRTQTFWSSLGLSGSDALFEVAAFWTYHTDYKHWRYYLGSDVWYLQCK
ncbi:SDR family NAD(P)-dependent oxidoreductase [Escherichia coli]|uniref:SDR family NAD(P)-dependent oxidoreductase n=1 Tax=Escherichia coli TaxID=562 RepID=UPI00388F178B